MINMDTTKTTNLKASVIICGYTMDRFEDIRDAVDSVLVQTSKPHEVIVSVDHTEELYNRLSDELPPEVKVVLNQGSVGLSETRNTGLRAATGEILVFIDDDAVAEQDWLEKLIKHYENSKVVGAGGKAVPQWLDGGRPIWFPEELDWIIGCTHKGPAENGQAHAIRNMIGCNMSYRRDAFERAGQFNSELGRVGKVQGMGEDTEMGLRIRRVFPDSTIMYEPAAIIYHKVPSWRVSMKYLVKRSYQEGLYKVVVGNLSSESGSESFSSENSYLQHLLLTAVPRRLKSFYQKGSLSQAGAILTCIGAVGTGYLQGKLRIKKAS